MAISFVSKTKPQLCMECAYVKNGYAYVHIRVRKGNWYISEQAECGDRCEGRTGWQQGIVAAVHKVLQRLNPNEFTEVAVQNCKAEMNPGRKPRSKGLVSFKPGSCLCPGDSGAYCSGPQSFALMIVDAANRVLDRNPALCI